MKGWKRMTKQRRQRLEAAAKLCRDRQDRRKDPIGYLDNHGRWYPSAEEEQDCCSNIRLPSRAYPYSLLVHACTARHVAQLMDIPRGVLIKKLKEIT